MKQDYIKLKDVPPIVLELTGVDRTAKTIESWARKGRRGYDNTLVKLKTRKRLGTRFTTRQWIIEFLEQMD